LGGFDFDGLFVGDSQVYDEDDDMFGVGRCGSSEPLDQIDVKIHFDTNLFITAR